jgi:hypothetical protein
MKGGLTGMVAGGALGALVASLAAVGSVAVPGAGLLVTGPIAATFSGAAVGGMFGGLSGALVAATFSEDEAGKFSEELEQGKVVLAAHPRDEQQQAIARAILASPPDHQRTAV